MTFLGHFDMQNAIFKARSQSPSAIGTHMKNNPNRQKNDKTPEKILSIPHNLEAEVSLLGSVLLDNSALDSAADRIEPDDFYSALNKEIFSAMLTLHEAGKPIDLASLYTATMQLKLLEEAGGMHYLASLTQHLPAAINIQRYAEIIQNASLLRQAIDIMNQYLTAAQLPIEDVSTFLDDLNQRTFQLTIKNTAKPYFTLNEAMKTTFELIESLHDSSDQVPGVSSGFIDFDKKTAGFRPGTLTIVAARPAMGKTALALNFLTNAAIDYKVPAAFFSLEMTKEELCSRVISSRAKIHANNLRTGNLSDAEWNRLLSTMDAISNARIFIDETPAISITKLSAKARRLKAEANIGLIVIDYLQLMTGSGYTPSREQEISEISRSLKSLSKELGIPIIALSQLNRGVESRPDKRPMLQDLRESGAIEQDADMIAFIYRDDYYNKDSPDKGVSEIIIAKQRSGETGTIKLKWFGEYTLFENLAQDIYPE